MQFTITSYNIHKGMSPLNRTVILPKIANALKMLAPDIICLQEVQGQNLKRALVYSEYPDQAQHQWFGEYLDFCHGYGKNAEYGHGHHSNAVLSRHSLDPKHNVNITVNRLEQRGVLHCEITPKDYAPIIVLCAHLNLLEYDRTKQYQAICDYINTLPKDQPLILAGDFNDWRKRACAQLSDLCMTEVFGALGKRLPNSFPAQMPMLSLDRIYIRALKVLDACMHTGKPWAHLSDHLPISATLAYL